MCCISSDSGFDLGVGIFQRPMIFMIFVRLFLLMQVDKYAEENALRAKLGIKPLRDE